MTKNGQSQGPGQGTPEPQGYRLGMPYDWRKPTRARARSRMWNPDDPRLWPPKAFGWGYSLNLYWVRHPLRYLAGRP